MANWSYVSVTGWPAGVDEDWCVEALTRSTGIDGYRARLITRKGVPAIVARLEPAAGAAAAAELRRRGANAFAPTWDELKTVPHKLVVKHMQPAIGAPEPMYSLELWQGQPAVLHATHIGLLVRGRLRVGTRAPTKDQPVRRAGGMASMGAVLGGVEGMMIGAAIDSANAVPAQSPMAYQYREFLDLYDREHGCYRIDGNKFAFEVLGAERAMTKEENMDRLAVRLAREAPGAIVDTGFGGFRAISEAERDMQAFTHGLHRDAAPFDFYSAWVVLMYRAVPRDGNHAGHVP